MKLSQSTILVGVLSLTIFGGISAIAFTTVRNSKRLEAALRKPEPPVDAYVFKNRGAWIFTQGGGKIVLTDDTRIEISSGKDPAWLSIEPTYAGHTEPYVVDSSSSNSVPITFPSVSLFDWSVGGVKIKTSFAPVVTKSGTTWIINFQLR